MGQNHGRNEETLSFPAGTYRFLSRVRLGREKLHDHALPRWNFKELARKQFNVSFA